MRKVFSFFDWRFITALTFCMVVVYIIYTVIQAFTVIDERGQHVDQLISANTELRNTNDRLFTEARVERREASRERLEILRYNKAQAKRLREILIYLDKEGIDLPTELLQPIVPPDISGSTGPQKNNPPPNKGNGSNSNSPGGKGNGGKPPGDNGPGKSDDAPGHNKPPKKHKKKGKGHK